MPSVVTLTMRDRNGQPLAFGTGFVVAPSIIATNAHVIAGSASGSAKFLTVEQSLAIEEVVGIDQRRDLALLRVTSSQPALPLEENRSVEVGEGIFAIGNPEGLEGTFSTGVLSAVRAFGTDTVLQITAPISPGSSGGPVLDENGKVVGVATATFREGQNLNFAVPASYVAALLQSNADPVPLAAVDRPRKDAGTQWTGSGEAAIVGENFDWAIEFDLNGKYSLSLRNRSGQSVGEVYAVVIFHDRRGLPVETDVLFHSGRIEPGLATRVQGEVDPSVKRITTPADYGVRYGRRPTTKLEVRVLKYRVVQ